MDRLPLLADMVSGPRTAGIGGAPTPRRIESGDPIIADLVPRHKGYWGDSCNTCVVGGPTVEQRRFFDGISEALHAAIDSVRPGLKACDLDFSVRQHVLRLGGGYPHHTGHSLGAPGMRNLASALITPCLSKRIWSSHSSRAFTSKTVGGCDSNP